MFVISDEIDLFNSKFGVYGLNEEKTMSGVKLLCQGFDGIKEETRATGSTSVTIKKGTISLLGASTGDKLWSNTLKFSQNYGSDGLAVRFTFHVLPMLPLIEPPMDFFIYFPNLVHLFIVIVLLAKWRPHLVFRQLLVDVDTRPTSNYFDLI